MAAGPIPSTGYFRNRFATHAAALAAAPRAATEQRVPGRTEAIEYETPDGKWHTETAAGNDRPETDVEDSGSCSQTRNHGASKIFPHNSARLASRAPLPAA